MPYYARRDFRPRQPHPSLAAALLDALADPTTSLPALAASHKTTTEALAAWMTRDDTRARITLIQSAVLLRAQLIAAINQTAAIAAAMGILDAFKNARVNRNTVATPDALAKPTQDQSPSAQDQANPTPDRHWCETARRAASLIFRMSQPQPAPQPRALAVRPDSQAALAHPPAARQPTIAIPASKTPSNASPQLLSAPSDFEISDFRSEIQRSSAAPAPHPTIRTQRSTADTPTPPALPATLDSPRPLPSDSEISDLRSLIQPPPTSPSKPPRAPAPPPRSRLAELACQASGP